jgi:small-conductance mechanosensitive channel
VAADLDKLIAQLLTRQGLMEFALIAAAFALAWVLVRPLKSRLPANLQPGALKIGAGSLHRVAFPVLALVLVWAGRLVLVKWQAVPLLNVAIVLVASFAAIRLAVYLLRHALPPSKALKASERFIFYSVWGLVALYLTGVLPEFKAALEEVNFTAGKQTITLLMMLQALFWATVTVFIALTVSRLIEQRLNAATSLDNSFKAFTAKLVRALAVTIAILIALPIVGIDITVLSVFGGALGVGLGLGMQKIASNYVSGFAILLDRSIRPGDVVSVGERRGVVSDIKTRYTVIQCADGTEAIVPNDTMVSSVVLNHARASRAQAIRIPFVLATDSDLTVALAAAEAAARAQPLVLATPQPLALLTGLVENGIACELTYSIHDADLTSDEVRSRILRDVIDKFAENGVKFAKPP